MNFYNKMHNFSCLYKLEDFTLFIQKESKVAFSGRLLDIMNAEQMQISTNKDVIQGLKRQFQALTSFSTKYVPGNNIDI